MLTRERWAILLLGAAGAAFLPGALNRFVFPKLAVVALGVALALSVHARGRLPRSVMAPLAASAVILLIAALTGATPVPALLGRPPRYEGLVALPVYVGALVAGARLLGPQRPEGAMAWLLDAVSAAAVLIGIEAALEAAGLRPLVSNVARPGSLLGNASDQGAWALLALGPLAAVAVRYSGALHRAGAIGAAVALATSGSRGALAGAAVLLLVLILQAPGRQARIVLAAGAALVAAGVLALPATRARVLTSTHLSQQSLTGHALLWGETLRLVVHHPLLGVGPSGYVDTIPSYHSRRYEREIGPANPPDSPEDWVLQALAAGGLALALIALGLAALVLRRGAETVESQRDPAERVALGGLLAGLAGYSVALLFHFTTAGTTPLAALFAGALVAVPATERQRADGTAGRTTIARYAAIALYAALTAVLVAGAIAEIPLRSALLQAAAGDLSAADHDFQLARDLRPWDPGVAQTATHAYAVLARDQVAGAARYGLPWAARELTAYPDSIQALEDAAALESAAGRPAAAARLLRQARRLEPYNPEL